MSDPWVVLAGIVVVAVVYVLLPVAGDAFLRFRATRHLRCPEDGENAEVGVDAAHAALTAAFRQPVLRVTRCSLWPEREGCEEHCVRPAETEPTEPLQSGAP